MASNFITNNVPIGIGYDSYGEAKGLSELSSISLRNLNIIASKSDFPDAVNDVITLADDTVYMLTTTVDLEGCRIQLGANSVIIGTSSEVSRLKSTGLTASSLITGNRSLPMRDITLEAVSALDLSGTSGENNALDWISVNFQDCSSVGIIRDYSNVIISNCAFLNSSKLLFDGSFDTIGISESIFSVGGDEVGIHLLPGSTITRRFRTIYSSIVANSAGSSGIVVDEAASIPIEGYILDTVNFGGAGSATAGLSYSGVDSLWSNCVGVTNTANISHYYLDTSGTTTFAATDTPTKIVATTISADATQKFTSTTSNRTTYTGGLQRQFKGTAVVTLTGASNKQYTLMFAKNGTPLPSSDVTVTTNAGERAEHGNPQVITSMNTGDYLEVWVTALDVASDIVITELNVIVEALN